MKPYFLISDGVGENDVTIVSEKSLLEMLGERYRGYDDAEESIKRTFEWAVDMAKGRTKHLQTIDLMKGHFYLCKSMAQVKAVKKREIRLQIQCLKEQMGDLEDGALCLSDFCL
tara:strand:- start:154 stop:495 length:342 start_codon:yes stop_codon:yes gene_type:complete